MVIFLPIGLFPHFRSLNVADENGSVLRENMAFPRARQHNDVQRHVSPIMRRHPSRSPPPPVFRNANLVNIVNKKVN